MRFLRLSLAFALLAGCADLSGLSDLGLADGGPDVTTFDGGGDDAPSDVSSSDVHAPSDASAKDSPNATPTGCATVVGVYDFCADFDEGDAAAGFADGSPAAWSSVSQAPPGLSTTTYLSPPASATFTNTQDELTYVSAAAPVTLTVGVHVNVLAFTPNANVVVEVLADVSHAIEIKLTSAGINMGVTIAEVTSTADAGLVVDEHVTGQTITPNGWHGISLTIAEATISGNIDGTPLSQIQRLHPAALGVPSTMLVSTVSGWSVGFDDVLIRHTN